MSLVVSQLTRQSLVDGLNIVADGDVDILFLTTRNHIEETIVSSVVATEEQLLLRSNTSSGEVAIGPRILDESGVQTLGELVLSEVVHSTFLVVLAAIEESNIAEGQVTSAVEVLPQRNVSLSVVQVQGTLSSETTNLDPADIDTALVTDFQCVASRSLSIEVIVDGELHLSQSVAQVELHAVTNLGLGQVNERKTRSDVIIITTQSNVLISSIRSSNTPKQVNRSSGIGANNVLHDGVASSAVLVDRNDVVVLQGVNGTC